MSFAFHWKIKQNIIYDGRVEGCALISCEKSNSATRC